jgi:hypothetical protein
MVSIKPEVGMPVLHWNVGAVEPRLDHIERVNEDGTVDLLMGYRNRPVRCGSGNQNEIGHTSEAFCEFPQWFVAIMNLVGLAQSPVLYAERPGPIPEEWTLPASAWKVFERHPREVMPGTHDPVRYDATVQPTSQVLG